MGSGSQDFVPSDADVVGVEADRQEPGEVEGPDI